MSFSKPEFNLSELNLSDEQIEVISRYLDESFQAALNQSVAAKEDNPSISSVVPDLPSSINSSAAADSSRIDPLLSSSFSSHLKRSSVLTFNPDFKSKEDDQLNSVQLLEFNNANVTFQRVLSNPSLSCDSLNFACPLRLTHAFCYADYDNSQSFNFTNYSYLPMDVAYLNSGLIELKENNLHYIPVNGKFFDSPTIKTPQKLLDTIPSTNVDFIQKYNITRLPLRPSFDILLNTIINYSTIAHINADHPENIPSLSLYLNPSPQSEFRPFLSGLNPCVGLGIKSYIGLMSERYPTIESVIKTLTIDQDILQKSPHKLIDDLVIKIFNRWSFCVLTNRMKLKLDDLTIFVEHLFTKLKSLSTKCKVNNLFTLFYGDIILNKNNVHNLYYALLSARLNAKFSTMLFELSKSDNPYLTLHSLNLKRKFSAVSAIETTNKKNNSNSEESFSISSTSSSSLPSTSASKLFKSARSLKSFTSSTSDASSETIPDTPVSGKSSNLYPRFKLREDFLQYFLTSKIYKQVDPLSCCPHCGTVGHKSEQCKFPRKYYLYACPRRSTFLYVKNEFKEKYQAEIDEYLEYYDKNLDRRLNSSKRKVTTN